MHEKLNFFLLLVLLLLLALIVRIGFNHPTDFDSMWIQGMAETINSYGYAKWIYHPMSLFGYYPLSYPSALMYFLAVVSAISGLSMNSTIHFTGILFGLVATMYVFLIGRIFGGPLVGYLASFIFSLSPIVINFSSYVASGRFFLILFFLVFLTFLLKIFKITENNLNNNNINISKFIKYWVTIGIALIYMFMTHRTAQLSLIILLAALVAYSVYKMPNIWKRLKGIKVIQSSFIKRYGRWNKWILVDFTIVMTSLAIYKVISLIHRGRLLINVERYFPWIIILASKIDLTILLTLGIFVLSIIIYFKEQQLVLILNKLSNFYSRIYNLILKNSDTYFFRFLLFLVLITFINQFLGKSFYSPSLGDYSETILFKGDNPPIIFINFLINFTSSVSIYSIFVIIGITSLYLKEKKNLTDLFMIFIIFAFAGILIDKSYVRLFITPILALITAMGLLITMRFIQNRYNKKCFKVAIILVVVIGSIGAFVPQIRERITGKHSFFNFQQQYWDIGQFISTLNCSCSTITTDEQVAGVTIFASSGMPGATHSVYYFVDENYLKPNPVNYDELLFNLKHGLKVTELWHLPDWIFGGDYYIGRHAINLFKRDYSNPLAQRIIEDYKMKYYIHDEVLQKPPFLVSIIPVKNKIYENGLANVYDLSRGR